MKKRNKIIIACVYLLAIISSIPPLASHFGDSGRYVSLLPLGEPYQRIIELVPQRLIREDIHVFDDTDWNWAVTQAPHMEEKPSYVMILSNRYLPFTAPLGYALYFDENKLLTGSTCSGL